MGFKFVKSYTNISPNINTLSLPYFQSQFTNASSLFNDITGCTQVCQFTASGAYDCWTPSSFNNFAINSQNGYAVGVGGATTQVIVGAHNPGLNISLSNVPPN